MDELLRDETLRLVSAVQDYISESQRRGVPPEESRRVCEAIMRVLERAYE